MEILLLHTEHRPFNPRKLKTGINSYQKSFLEQVIQELLPPSVLDVFNLKIATLRKDPMISPKQKKIKVRVGVIN